MIAEPGWYADPLGSGRLRLWDGTAWTDQTRPRPSASQRRAKRIRPRRTVFIDSISLVLAMVFLIGVIELGWRKSALPPATDAAATLAVSSHRASQDGGDSTSFDVISAPASPTTTATSIRPPNRTPATRPPPTTTTTRPETPNTPAARPAGDSGSSRDGSSNPHDYTLTGYLWKPCQDITVSSLGPDVTGIITELATISGLPLHVVNGPADITVAWGAIALPHALGITEGTAADGFFAHVTITLAPRGASSLTSLLRHELGHALGLGHADQPNAIMYPVLRSDAPSDYQAGDRAGLQTIGAASRDGAHC